VVSEGLETFMKIKNLLEYKHCVIDSCQLVDEKDEASENLEVDSLFKVKDKKNIIKGYNETLRLQCKLKNESFSLFSKEFNVIQ
jgi:hypothetical protein